MVTVEEVADSRTLSAASPESSHSGLLWLIHTTVLLQAILRNPVLFAFGPPRRANRQPSCHWIVALLWPRPLLLVYWPVSSNPDLTADILLGDCKLSGVCMDVSSWRNCTAGGNQWHRQNSGRIRKGGGEWNDPKVDFGLCSVNSWTLSWTYCCLFLVSLSYIVFCSRFSSSDVVCLSAWPESSWNTLKGDDFWLKSWTRADFLDFWILIFSTLISSSVISHAFGGVDYCWQFFHCWYSFFSEAPGPFPFVSCIAVRKTDALNNYYQRLFLKSCQLLAFINLVLKV